MLDCAWRIHDSPAIGLYPRNPMKTSILNDLHEKIDRNKGRKKKQSKMWMYIYDVWTNVLDMAMLDLHWEFSIYDNSNCLNKKRFKIKIQNFPQPFEKRRIFFILQ